MSGCSVVSVPQVQFTPLADALCWVILRLTQNGGQAEAETVRDALMAAFPNLNTPDTSHIHATLSNLIRQCKVYYSGSSYGIVQPDTYRPVAVCDGSPSSASVSSLPAFSASQQLRNGTSSLRHSTAELMSPAISCTSQKLQGNSNSSSRMQHCAASLMSPVMSCTSHPLQDSISIKNKDGTSDAAVQTNLAELITGVTQHSYKVITPTPPGRLPSYANTVAFLCTSQMSNL